MKRILFLDDDPKRCEAFLKRVPTATVVHTAEACIDALGWQYWDEVHLDHDLGGEHFVDSFRADCGMEVVRWVVLARPDVREFIVHTYNPDAALLMVPALRRAGYVVHRIPFPIAV